MASNNFFDLVFTLLAPELKALFIEIKGIKGVSRSVLSSFEKEFKNIRKQLPQLKGTDQQIKQAKQTLAKVFETDELNAFRQLLGSPGTFAEKLGKLSPKERKQVSEDIAAATGGIEESSLSSSWLISGIYEETGIGVGSLTLTTKQGKSYDYPNVSVLVWEQMKAAKGSNGSGAGSVFWALYLRKYNSSRTRARTSIAFRLAG